MLDKRRRDPTTRVGLVVAAAVIFLGILGMHALNLHGTTPMTGMAGMTGSPISHSPDTDTDTDTDTDNQANAAAVNGSQPPSLDTPVSPGHDMGNMVMLCVAMLAAAGIALLALLLRRAPRSNWLSTRPRPTAAIRRGLTATRTGTGPPSVWAFSVIRC